MIPHLRLPRNWFCRAVYPSYLNLSIENHREASQLYLACGWARHPTWVVPIQTHTASFKIHTDLPWKPLHDVKPVEVLQGSNSNNSWLADPTLSFLIRVDIYLISSCCDYTWCILLVLLYSFLLPCTLLPLCAILLLSGRPLRRAAIRSSIPPSPRHPPVGAASLIPARGSAIHSLQCLGRLLLGNEYIESEPDAKPAWRDTEFIDLLVL